VDCTGDGDTGIGVGVLIGLVVDVKEGITDIGFFIGTGIAVNVDCTGDGDTEIKVGVLIGLVVGVREARGVKVGVREARGVKVGVREETTGRFFFIG
jgi:hypothetical protein